MNTHQLNCRGLNCPMPIVELTKAARKAAPGDRIEITATDLAFRPDVEAWARRMGHDIESFEQTDNEQTAIIALAPQSN